MTETYCMKCGRRTKWTTIRNGKRQKCNECGTVFPCYGDCNHLDCAAEREEKGIK